MERWNQVLINMGPGVVRNPQAQFRNHKKLGSPEGLPMVSSASISMECLSPEKHTSSSGKYPHIAWETSDRGALGGRSIQLGLKQVRKCTSNV